MAWPLPMPGGPTNKVKRVGYNGEPIVRTQIFLSIAAARKKIATHFLNKGGDGSISVNSRYASIQLPSRLMLAGADIGPLRESVGVVVARLGPVPAHLHLDRDYEVSPSGQLQRDCHGGQYFRYDFIFVALLVLDENGVVTLQ